MLTCAKIQRKTRGKTRQSDCFHIFKKETKAHTLVSLPGVCLSNRFINDFRKSKPSVSDTDFQVLCRLAGFIYIFRLHVEVNNRQLSGFYGIVKQAQGFVHQGYIVGLHGFTKLLHLIKAALHLGFGLQTSIIQL